MINYIKNSFKELSKVSWPTMQQTIKLTTYTVVFTVVLALVIGGLDYVFNAGYQAVVNYSITSGFGQEAPATETPTIDAGDLSVGVDAEGVTTTNTVVVPEPTPAETTPAEQQAN